jgi:hypothetical protein
MDIGVYILDDNYQKSYLFPHQQGSFDVNLFGGCGLGRFRTGWRFDLYDELNQQYQRKPMKVEVLDQPLWQGRIVEIRHSVSFGKEWVELICEGWGQVLKHVAHQRKYIQGRPVLESGITINRYSDIVRDLALVVARNSQCDITVGTIQDSDLMPTRDDGEPSEFTIRFNHVHSAMETLAKLAGNWQWGVDRNRQLNFLPAPTNVHHHFQVGKDIVDYKPLNSTKEIVNRVLLRGGTGKNVEGEEYRFFYTDYDAASESQYGTHMEIKSVPEINDRQTADRYCEMLFADQAEPQDRVAVTVIPAYTLCEPYLGQVHIFCPPNHHQTYPIMRTKYTIDDRGIFAKPELGRYPPALSTMIERLGIEIGKLQKEGAADEFFRFGDDWQITMGANLACAFEFSAGP